jgi:hypothetical protein
LGENHEKKKLAATFDLLQASFFLILFLDKKLYWIPERNLRQTRRSPQSIMEIYGQGLQRSPGANKVNCRAAAREGGLGRFAGKT